MRTRSTSNQVDHRHEFEPLNRDRAFELEDGAAIFTYKCRFRPVIETAHSAKLDEVFTQEGDECGEIERIRLEAQTDDRDVTKWFEQLDRDPNDGFTIVSCIPPDPYSGTDGSLVLERDGTRVSYE